MSEARFSHRAGHYDESARLQKRITDKLVSHCLEQNLPIAKVADLGCGTGFVSESLLNKITPLEIHCCDISNEMLDCARHKLIKYKKVSFHKSSLAVDNEYDLIISNFAFQWFEDLEKTLNDSYQRLKTGGMLTFTLPVEGTFDHIAIAAESADLQYCEFPFHSENSLKKLAANFLQNECEVFEELDIFDNSLNFFRNIHLTGATFTQTQLNAHQLRKLIKAHDLLFEGKITAKYRIALITIIKE